MKLMRFNRAEEPVSLARLGVLLKGDVVADVRAGYARFLAEERDDVQGREIAALRFPPHVAAFLGVGRPGWEALAEVEPWLRRLGRAEPRAHGLDGQPLFTPLAECRLHATSRPSKVIAVGRNYAEHLKEAGITLDHKVPSAWIKANSTIVGPTRDIVKPRAVKELDYEAELAVVIGRRCKDVPENEAYDVVAGYTVLNDVSARDIVRIERKEGNQLLGKMFDTFCPMGPWLVTRDEVPDPMRLRIVTRVNGEVRQDGSTAGMIWPIPKLIAYISQLTLEPGDVIATGTPSGVAMGRKEGQRPWWLQAGDILESEIERIGTLRNRIVDEPRKKAGWKW